jgi:5-methylcytosine-specific restriction endonuclease McrA
MPFATKAIRDRNRKRIARLVAAGQPCCFCQRPIDLSLRWPDPWCFVVDHSIPTSRGGGDNYDPLRPAHNHCNRQGSNQPDGTIGRIGRNSGALG